MNRLNPITPTLSLGRTAPSRTMFASHDAPGMAKLLAEAQTKFQTGFAAAQNNNCTAHQRPRNHDDDDIRASQSSVSRGSSFDRKMPMGRCNSVLGIRSDEREINGNLRRIAPPGGDKLTLDYVDLECLLQEKMRELNVQMPKFKNSRIRHIGDNNTAHCQSSGASDGGDCSEFALRVKEAAYLFRLCQKEIQLQVSVSCPERSRLIDQALEFWSCVLDCLVTPLDHTRAQVAKLRQSVARHSTTLQDICAQMCQWSKENIHLLDCAVWHQLPHTGAQSASSALRNKLRTLALRSCYATGAAQSAKCRSNKRRDSGEEGSSLSSSSRAQSPPPPQSPSPPLLSRASTSLCRKEEHDVYASNESVAEVDGAAALEEGAWEAEGQHALQQDVPEIVKAMLACLTAACNALEQLQDDKHKLQQQLDTQQQAAVGKMALTLNTHAAELHRMQAALEEQQRADAEAHATAQHALAAARAACAASEACNAQLQQQVAALKHAAKELETRAAAAAAASAALVGELEQQAAAAHAAHTGLEALCVEQERLSAEELAREHEKLTSAINAQDELRAQLSRLTRDGVVLTPRPAWQDEGGGESESESSAERVSCLLKGKAEVQCRVSALEQQVAALKSELEALKETSAQERAQGLIAEDVSRKLAAELQAIRDRPRAYASCGCPEPPEDRQVVMIELSEYLTVYLSKRFGLQGHMASWEVDKMSKDVGWLMEQPVRSACQTGV